MDALIRSARIAQTKLPNEEIKINMGIEGTLIEDIIWVGHILPKMKMDMVDINRKWS